VQAFSLCRLVGQIDGDDLPPQEGNQMINTIIEQGMMSLSADALNDDTVN